MVEQTNTPKVVQLPNSEESKNPGHEFKTMFGTLESGQFNAKVKELFSEITMNELEKQLLDHHLK